MMVGALRMEKPFGPHSLPGITETGGQFRSGDECVKVSRILPQALQQSYSQYFNLDKASLGISRLRDQSLQEFDSDPAPDVSLKTSKLLAG